MRGIALALGLIVAVASVGVVASYLTAQPAVAQGECSGC